MYTVAYARKVKSKSLDFLGWDKEVDIYNFNGRNVYVSMDNSCLRCYEVLPGEEEALLLTFTDLKFSHAKMASDGFFKRMKKKGVGDIEDFVRVAVLTGCSNKGRRLGQFGNLYNKVSKSRKTARV